MFCIGDYVVHPMHGAGVINGIVQERVNGTLQDYYVFQMPVGGLLLKIPVANSRAVGLRAVMGRDEADALLRAIPAMDVELCANWNRRYRENMDRLKSGDLYEVARVIKSLSLREREHGLSTGERKLLHSAKQILISELVLICQCPYDVMERRIDQAVSSKES